MASIAPAGWKAKCNASRMPLQFPFNLSSTIMRQRALQTLVPLRQPQWLQRAADVPKIVSYVLIDAAIGTSAFVVQLLYPSRSEAKRKILLTSRLRWMHTTFRLKSRCWTTGYLTARVHASNGSGSNNGNNNDNSGGAAKWRISLSSSTSSGADDMVDSFLTPLPSVNFCIELSFPESVQFDAYMMSQTMPGANLIAYSEKTTLSKFQRMDGVFARMNAFANCLRKMNSRAA